MPRPNYIKLSKNQLHNLLIKRNLPDFTVNQIKEDVATRKKQIQKARVENRVRCKRWAELIKPLTREINSVRTNLKYHAIANPHLHQFYTEYLDCLLETRIILTNHKLERRATPINTDRTKRNWVDYVPPETKQRFTQTYNNLPYNPKVRRKELFPQPRLNNQEQPVSAKTGVERTSTTQQKETA